MPNASIAVLREEALSASRLVALRKITSLPAACRSNGSLEGEQPRAPGARVTAPAAVAAAAAVADADIALAARVHAVDQLLEIGRAHVCTPVTNAQLVCRLLLETKKA